MKGATVKTLGCRLNIWESEVIRDHTRGRAFDNAVIVNSCAVTADAEKQTRKTIRTARREQPDARIIVTGCAAQINPDAWRNMAEVDDVVGNHEKLHSAYWNSFRYDKTPRASIGDIMEVREVAAHLLSGFDHHSRAFLQIQQGCDHRCTFCIIPYGRGPSRSVVTEDIIAQATQLADAGIGEIVLTGVDISSWGADLPPIDEVSQSLGQMVAQLLKSVPHLPRLRLSSLDPAVTDDALFAVLANEPRLMPHLHLSAQHGDALILKRMKRRHSPDDLTKWVAKARAARPDVVFGADLIAGFPTETQEAHERTIQMIDALDLCWLHIFPYSPRSGTPAASMPQLPKKTITSRAADLRRQAARRQNCHLDRMVGQSDEILLETGGIGHSRNFSRIKIVTGVGSAGEIHPVKVLRRTGDFLEAEILS